MRLGPPIVSTSTFVQSVVFQYFFRIKCCTKVAKTMMKRYEEASEAKDSAHSVSD